MRAYGQKLVKFCTLTHTHTTAAKLVVRILLFKRHLHVWRYLEPDSRVYLDTVSRLFLLNHMLLFMELIVDFLN